MFSAPSSPGKAGGAAAAAGAGASSNASAATSSNAGSREKGRALAELMGWDPLERRLEVERMERYAQELRGQMLEQQLRKQADAARRDEQQGGSPRRPLTRCSSAPSPLLSPYRAQGGGGGPAWRGGEPIEAVSSSSTFASTAPGAAPQAPSNGFFGPGAGSQAQADSRLRGQGEDQTSQRSGGRSQGQQGQPGQASRAQMGRSESPTAHQTHPGLGYKGSPQPPYSTQQHSENSTPQQHFGAPGQESQQQHQQQQQQQQQQEYQPQQTSPHRHTPCQSHLSGVGVRHDMDGHGVADRVAQLQDLVKARMSAFEEEQRLRWQHMESSLSNQAASLRAKSDEVLHQVVEQRFSSLREELFDHIASSLDEPLATLSHLRGLSQQQERTIRGLQQSTGEKLNDLEDSLEQLACKRDLDRLRNSVEGLQGELEALLHERRTPPGPAKLGGGEEHTVADVERQLEGLKAWIVDEIASLHAGLETRNTSEVTADTSEGNLNEEGLPLLSSTVEDLAAKCLEVEELCRQHLDRAEDLRLETLRQLGKLALRIEVVATQSGATVAGTPISTPIRAFPATSNSSSNWHSNANPTSNSGTSDWPQPQFPALPSPAPSSARPGDPVATPSEPIQRSELPQQQQQQQQQGEDEAVYQQQDLQHGQSQTWSASSTAPKQQEQREDLHQNPPNLQAHPATPTSQERQPQHRPPDPAPRFASPAGLSASSPRYGRQFMPGDTAVSLRGEASEPVAWLAE